MKGLKIIEDLNLLSEEEENIKGKAVEFARKNKQKIAKEFADPEAFLPEEEPVSVFMAGSPGAGKTEASIALLKSFETDGNSVLRIDPDDLRAKCPGYDGTNSWLFHPAVSILVDRIHDLALKQQQSFILDGTLASYDVAERNIERSLRRNRVVQILYVYQDPIQAWQFVLAREEEEGRRIRRDDFIKQYFAARENVNRLKEQFKKKIKVTLLIKNNDGSQKAYKDNIERIDSHVPEDYAPADLEELLDDPHGEVYEA